MRSKFSIPLLSLLALTMTLGGQNYADTTTPPAKPALMLAKPYRSDVELSHYWVSEKLDGVRAYWNGQQLISRQGHIFSAPTWFTAKFPTTPLDGELWMGRNQFAAVSGAVRRQTPAPEQWQKIRLMVFDMPSETGNFDHRVQAMRTLFAEIQSPYLALIKQYKVSDEAELMSELNRVIAGGGEGLMLHLGSAPYRGIRSDDLLKLKRFADADAIVIAHIPGKGKFAGMLGALLVKTPEGRRFKIGSGFSDEQRRQPPAIGSTVSYKYQGFTASGLPRFASFFRERDDL